MTKDNQTFTSGFGGRGAVVFVCFIFIFLSAGIIYYYDRSSDAEKMVRSLRGQQSLLHDENLKLKAMNDRLQAEVLEVRQLLRDREKAAALVPSVVVPPAPSLTQPKVAPSKPEVKIPASAEIVQQAQTKFKPLSATPWKIQCAEADGHVILTLPIGVWIAAGGVEVKPEASKAVGTIADWIKELPESWGIEVIGHSDNTPPQGTLAAKYKDSLGVSTARAKSLVGALGASEKSLAGRIKFSGAGDSKPLAPNTSKENREQNRRLEIIITPKA